MKGLDAMLNRVILQGRLTEVPELKHTVKLTRKKLKKHLKAMMNPKVCFE